MTGDHLLLILLVGLVAGFLATHAVSGHGYGVLGDVVVGVIGALLGTLILGGFLTAYILAPLGIVATSVLGQLIIAFVGAVILLAILRLVTHAGWGRGPRRRFAPRYHERRRWL